MLSYILSIAEALGTRLHTRHKSEGYKQQASAQKAQCPHGVETAWVCKTNKGSKLHCKTTTTQGHARESRGHAKFLVPNLWESNPPQRPEAFSPKCCDNHTSVGQGAPTKTALLLPSACSAGLQLQDHSSLMRSKASNQALPRCQRSLEQKGRVSLLQSGRSMPTANHLPSHTPCHRVHRGPDSQPRRKPPGDTADARTATTGYKGKANPTGCFCSTPSCMGKLYRHCLLQKQLGRDKANSILYPHISLGQTCHVATALNTEPTWLIDPERSFLLSKSKGSPRS